MDTNVALLLELQQLKEFLIIREGYNVGLISTQQYTELIDSLLTTIMDRYNQLDQLKEKIMANGLEKEVKFDEYCKKCSHWEEKESSDVCNDCLNVPGRADDSHKPINFKQKED